MFGQYWEQKQREARRAPIFSRRQLTLGWRKLQSGPGCVGVIARRQPLPTIGFGLRAPLTRKRICSHDAMHEIGAQLFGLTTHLRLRRTRLIFERAMNKQAASGGSPDLRIVWPDVM